MGRLTMRDENGNACYIKYGSLTPATMEGMGVNKLCDYEDAEEQGVLIKLPCPLGTPIYWIIKVCQMPDDYQCHRDYVCTDCDECLQQILEIDFRYSMLDDFGKLKDGYYINKSEAEARLEEIRRKNASKK